MIATALRILATRLPRLPRLSVLSVLVVAGLAGPGLAGPAAQAAAAPGPQPAPQAAPAAPDAAGQASTQNFAEKVLVREIEVIVEIPTTLRESRRKELGTRDFQVQEDGVFRQVVKASPVASAGDPSPWRLVLYFDRVLADPATIFVTANALARHAGHLAALGEVDVVVADPLPHSLLVTHEPKDLEQALIDVAARAERQRSGEASATPRPDAAAVTTQEDRLVNLLTAMPPGGPHALFLVANGFDTSTSGGNADHAAQAVAEEPARTLAAYGWVTFAAPMRKDEKDVERREVTDIERMRQAESGTPGSVVPPETAAQLGPRSKLNYDGVLDLFTEPASASLNAVAAATGGTVVGFPSQLDGVIAGIAKRWHLFYLAPDPEDGRPHPVEVRLVPENNILRAPVWRRSSTPDEASAARARQLLSGAADHGTLTVRAAASPHAVRVTLGAWSTPDNNPPGPFRVTFAFASAGAGATAGANSAPVVVQHRLLTQSDLTEKGWTSTVAVDIPAASRRVAITVEDLAHQLWGGTTLDLNPAATGGHP